MTIPSLSSDIPYLTTSQMVEVDRLMVEEYHIGLVQMMENAGRNLAHLARERFMDGDPVGKRVMVAAGSGGNGGGALVCARRLSNWGAEVWVALTQPAEVLAPVPAHQLDVLRSMDVPIAEAEGIAAIDASGHLDLVIDGIIGYSLTGKPEGGAASLIVWSNTQAAPVLSLDVPSGIDATTGEVYDPAIRATATMTLALPKQGLRMREVKDHVGELYLADISVPPSLYGQSSLGLDVRHLFAESDIMRLE